jgi:hypothetical protein
MTDSPNRRHLSRRVVVACYAISVGGFLGMSMVGTGFVMGDPWFALLFPVYGFPLVVRDMMGDPATELGKLQTLLLLLCLCPMLLPLLGLSGFVISLRRPDRSGWFVCGHVCLGVYYLLCALLIMLFALLSALGSGPS